LSGRGGPTSVPAVSNAERKGSPASPEAPSPRPERPGLRSPRGRLLGVLARGLLAGTAGTAAFALAYRIEHRLRPRHAAPLDYDDSDSPGRALATVIGLHEVAPARARALSELVRWGYGPVLGIPRAAMVGRVGEPWATLAHAGATTTTGALLFPVLARTPPPWRWPPDVIATALLTHLAYAAVASAACIGAERPGPG
jgi:hypothetical protein